MVKIISIICLWASFAGSLGAQSYSNQLVNFRRVGTKIEFCQPQGSVSFSLQAQVKPGSAWIPLSTTPATSNPVVSMTIPPQARNRNLQVVASVRPANGERRNLAFSLAPNGKSLTFRATPQARLYSVERYQTSSRKWSRISTVAAAVAALQAAPRIHGLSDADVAGFVSEGRL